MYTTPVASETRMVQHKWILELEELPDEILVEIFVRLPSQSIHTLHIVSKKLLNIVGNRLFSTLHLSSPAPEVPRLMITIKSDYPDGAWAKGISTTIQLLKYNPCTSSLQQHGHNNTHIFGSDNIVRCVFRNLFCFAGEDHPQSCFLFNPLRGEVVMLPSVPLHYKPFSFFGMGLGFDSKTNTLTIKVVAISAEDSQAYIYETGSSSWRRIPSVSHQVHQVHSRFMGVSAFGNMFYWLVCLSKCFLSFDFNREVFDSIPHPDPNGGGPFHLLNFRGSLAAVNLNTPSNYTEIWVLADPNKEWTLNYRIQRDVCLTGPGRGRLRHCGGWEHGLFFVEYHAKWGEKWSNAIFLDLRCGGYFKRVLFPEEFGDWRMSFDSAGRLFSFTGSTISLKDYADLLEAKQGEWHIIKGD